MNRKRLAKALGCVSLAILAFAPPVVAVSPTFTYQGYLRLGGDPVNGACDFHFRLYNALEGGTQLGITQPASGVVVTEGIFTTLLDLGSQPFDGNDRYMEMDVRCNSTGAYVTLQPRQALTATPYALYANAAGVASNLTCSSCISAAQIATASIEGGDISPGTIQLYHLGFTPGTVRTIIAGDGLTGGVITDSGTLGVDFGTTAGTVAAGNHDHPMGYWRTDGNAGSNAALDFLGTTDDQPLELRINAQRALRLQPGTSPSVIAGWAGNVAEPSVDGGAVGGGGAADDGMGGSGVNRVSGDFGTVAGGVANAAAMHAAVGGGRANSAEGTAAVVGGGFGNRASAAYATVGGGGRTDIGNAATANIVTDDYGTIGGGGDNLAGTDNTDATDAVGATVGGGGVNTASAPHATVSGGFLNLASGLQAVVSGGSVNSATGAAATVPGGFFNSAEGSGSLAAGANAHATHDGSFVWSDGSASVSSNGVNQFVVRATGGFRFVYSSSGAHCDLNSVVAGWQCFLPSDRNAKRDTAPVNPELILERLAAVPIQTWSYTAQDASIRHIGPMAQDFHAAFLIGENDREINATDAYGVAMAAVQGLYRKIHERDDVITALQRQIAALEERLHALEHR